MQQGFSFDKCFKQGIPSLPLDIARQQFGRKKADREPNRRGKVDVRSERDKEFVHQLKATLAPFLASPSLSMDLNTPNSYFRLVAYQEIRSLEEEGHSLDTQKLDDGNLRVVKVSEAEKAALDTAKAEESRIKGEEAVGFSTVIDMLGKSGLPLVGHNLLLDIAYSMEHFVGPLPEKWDDFKAKVSSIFKGGVYDTKYICGQTPELFPEGTALAKACAPSPTRNRVSATLCPIHPLAGLSALILLIDVAF